MTLATVDERGRPSARIVLIKGVDERGFTFFTNYESRKGRELAANGAASLLFHWIELERQVRIEGFVVRTSAEESDTYFASRPLGSRIGAWASEQSQVIESRAVLEARERDIIAQYGDHPPRPPHWGGYRLVPDHIEFWQGRPSRLHDRLVYTRETTDGNWRTSRLSPDGASLGRFLADHIGFFATAREIGRGVTEPSRVPRHHGMIPSGMNMKMQALL